MSTGTELSTGPVGPDAHVRSGGAVRDLWMRYRWIGTRILIGVLILFVVSLLIFIITMVLPGDAAQTVLGTDVRPSQVAFLRHQMGLDLPVWQQYTNWLFGVLRGNPGTSLISGEAIGPVIAFRATNTLTLLLCSAVIGLPLATLLGVLAAIKPKGVVDHLVNVISVVIASLPEFVIGILLIMLLSTGAFHLLPAVSLISPGDSPFAHPTLLVLPVATLVLALQPYMSRQVRASLQDVLDSEYVLMAEVKGLPRRVILIRHGLRNAITAAIQAAALSLAFLLGGTVVVEFLFQYPGLGTALTLAVQQRDVPTIQIIVLIFAAGIVLFNLLADIFTVLVTPKLRTQ